MQVVAKIPLLYVRAACHACVHTLILRPFLLAHLQPGSLGWLADYRRYALAREVFEGFIARSAPAEATKHKKVTPRGIQLAFEFFSTPTTEAAAAPGTGEEAAAASEPPHSKHGETRGKAPGTMRRGKTMTFNVPVFQNIPLVMRDGKVVQQMLRVPAETEVCVIDTLRIVMSEETLHRQARQTILDDADIAREVSKLLYEIFGVGITRKYDKGRDFYLEAWEIGDNMGHFAIGGLRQRETILISINGHGCLGAKEGWEQRLYDFLTSDRAIKPKITRVDLAHDDFEGRICTVDDYDKSWDEGGFDRYGNRPEPGLYGAWKNGDPYQKGRTFYAGTKSSSQLFRGYEKGKQLGGIDSPWVRSEVQFSNHDKVIPFDILIDPSSYFIAAYPVLAQFSPKRAPKKTEIIKVNVQVCIDHYFRHAKKAYGRFIKVARGLFGDEDVLNRLQSDTDEWPERLKYPDHKFTSTPIHELPKPVVLDFLGVISAAPSFGYNGDSPAFGSAS